MARLIAFGIAAVLAAASTAPAKAQVTGAGSTFAEPILYRWSDDYQKAQADKDYQPVGVALDYEPIGSEGGLLRVKDRAVDFGATDVPLRSAELARLELGQFPLVIGGIVAVVSVPGVAPGQMKLTGELLADIYQAKVKTWADPAIKALNPGLSLPDAPIAVVHRAEGSGTTFNFTAFLARHSPEWQAKVGADLVVVWPTGIGAKGNDGVAQAVGRTANAIGYLNFAQAARAGLSHVLIKNRAGAFVQPGVETFQAAAASADWGAAKDFDLLLLDAPAADAYPIVATTFALMPRPSPSPGRAQAALELFGWAFDKGGPAAVALGYVPLPPALVAQVKSYWATAGLAVER